jgi:hypothetical protein
MTALRPGRRAALARAAVASGTRVMAATPHIGSGYPVVPLELSARVWELERSLAEAGHRLEIVTGGKSLPAGCRSSAPDLAAVTLVAARASSRMPVLTGWATCGRLVETCSRRAFAYCSPTPNVAYLPARHPASRRAVERGAFVQLTAGRWRARSGAPPGATAPCCSSAGSHTSSPRTRTAPSSAPLSCCRSSRRPSGSKVSPTGFTSYLIEAVPRALLDDAPVPPAPIRSRRRLLRPRRQ